MVMSFYRGKQVLVGVFANAFDLCHPISRHKYKKLAGTQANYKQAGHIADLRLQQR